MDSGNSGSLQSSSGDEEYDSRADSISALMTAAHHHHHHHPTTAAAHHHHIGPISNNPQQQAPVAPPSGPPLNTTNTSSIFDPLSSYFDTISRPLQNPNSSLLNLEMSWSKTLRSDPNSTDISPNLNSNPMMVSASSIQSLFGSNQQLGSFTTTTQSQSQAQSVSIPPVPENNASATNTPRQVPAAADQNNPAPGVVRNPKKRSRASRRAPTTVLTTDTTNFRAMVQEFTGIPAPPFTSSSPFHRTRLDLYGTSVAPSSMRSNNPLDSPQQPPYLRRPFPQKVQLPLPFLASSSSSSSLLNSSLADHAAIASPNTTNNNNISSSNTYQLPPQTSNLFNLPNPILTSLLQSNNVKYPLGGSKTPQGLDDFGLGQGHVNTSSLSGLPGLISSDQTTSRNDNHPVNWGSASTGVGVNDGGAGGDQGNQSRSGNGNFSLSRVNNAVGANGKLNFTGSSSGFHGDKGSSDNAAVAVAPPTRGEGMMESWICSSD